MEWVDLARRRGGLRWVETGRLPSRWWSLAWTGVVGENDDLGQVILECWKVVGRQVAPVVLSGCDEMVGGGGVGRG